MTLLEAQDFLSPSPEFRPVPIWFWNGDLDESELRRQVRAMAEGGLGGFQVAARTGLTTPYLSNRWFSLIEAVTQEAQPYGLQVWLADEYPYPSGASGGELTLRHPEFRAWQMRARSVSAPAGECVDCLAPGTVLLSAWAAPVNDGKADWRRAVDLRDEVGIIQPEPVLVEPAFGYSGKRSFSFGPRPKLEWRAPAGPGSWEVWLVAAAEVAPYKFFGHYVDLCNPDAVRAFLATTYQRYAERLDAATLRQISGFFLDEAHPQTWSWRLPAAFLERNGYDLIGVLPALWTDIGPRTARVRYDYWQTLTGLFVESFHRPVADWCRDHGLKLSLEVDSPRNLVQRYADMGGNDPGHERVGIPLDEILAVPRPRYRVNPRFAASLAAQVGQRRVLDESFHSVGWSLTLQDMKAMVDRLAAQGANFFIFHAFFYTLGGLRKWDAPPSQFLQNPYWPHFGRFTAYLGRLCYALSRGRRVAPIALVDPITSLWTHGAVATGVSGPGPGPDDLATRIAGDWQYLLRELEAAQRQFDTLDPLLLSEGKVEDGVLRLGDAAYRVIVLPPMASLEQAAWAKLEQFAEQGGVVVGCGRLPDEAIESGSEVAERCAARFGVDSATVRHTYEGGDGAAGAVTVSESGTFRFIGTNGTARQTGAAETLLGLLDQAIPASVVLRPADPAARRSFLVAQREEADETLFFLVNASATEQECEIELRPSGAGRTHGGELVVEHLDLEDGARGPLSGVARTDGAGPRSEVVTLSFAPYGSRLLAVRPAEGAPTPPPSAQPSSVNVDLPIDDAWDCSLTDDNALRLDRFRLSIVAGPSDAADAAPAVEDGPLVEPKPLVNVLRDLEGAPEGWPVRLHVETPFGTPARIVLRLPVAAWYTTEFLVERLPERAVLCAEAAAFQGKWTIWLNGQPISPGAFRPRVRWDITNREADVRSLLRVGPNRLTVRVDVLEQTDGLVDALYLLGDFGVRFGESGVSVIGEVPQRVRWDHLHADGLPYYAAPLRLTRRITLPVRAEGESHASPGAPADERVTLSLPDEVLMYLGVAELSVNGRQLGVRPWAPYCWEVPPDVVRRGANDVEVTLTPTLVGLLEGKRYDPRRRTAIRVPEKRTDQG